MIDVIETLQKSEIEKLQDRSFLLSLIREYGIHNDSRISHMYGKENIPYLVQNGMLQIPEQIADALLYLSGKEIHQYLEIGTHNGKTTAFIVAYLTRFNPELKALTIDIHRRWSNPYKHLRIVEVEGTSDDWKGFQSDLCFIDGDHSIEWVKRDYENVGQYAQICMFHDIVEEGGIGNGKMDVKEFWGSIKKPTSLEFTTHGRMGIGIL